MKRSRVKELAIALYEATENMEGKNLQAVLNEFVKLLTKEGRLNQAERIISEFEAYAKKKDGIVSLQVTTVHPLNKKVSAQISALWKDKAEMTEVVDKSILGGIIIKTEDKILDASLKTQLNSLKKSLEK